MICQRSGWVKEEVGLEDRGHAMKGNKCDGIRGN